MSGSPSFPPPQHAPRPEPTNVWIRRSTFFEDAVLRGAGSELREGLIFEHSKRGRRGYQLPDLDVPDQPLEQLLPKTSCAARSRMKSKSRKSMSSVISRACRS